MNQVRAYWYMGSMEARSEIVKKRILLCLATGRYPLRTSSIRASVSMAVSCFSDISSDSTLEEDRISMAVSSSRIFP